jgi:hypothetical protein
MGGGLLQLIAVGQFDQLLSINPEISFYQYVYKRHSQFAMEPIQLTFTNNPVLAPTAVNNSYLCKVLRYADLLGKLHFCFTLPDIYSSDRYRFRWIKNVGTLFVKKATIYMNGNIIIDETTGEWMNIWNELTQCTEDNDDKLIGNVAEMQTPKLSVARITISNNRFIYYYYPESSVNENKQPSISGRRIIVPLNFWFTKNPALALPLLRLQFNEIFIRIETESSESLYQVWSPDLNRYVSPMYYNSLYNDNININTFTKNISLEPYIEANYIFLGEEERNTLFMKAKLTYLVEQLTITSAQSISSTSTASYNMKLMIDKPTKEIIWTLRRDDYMNFNEFNNYSADMPESSRGILDRALIKFNNNDRVSEKNAEFFNLIQPYQHHSRVPKQGIYCYSFAIHPEKEILTGYYNAALVETNLLVYLKNMYDNEIINRELIKIDKQPYTYNFLINVYMLHYNMFEIVGAQAGMKFTIAK